MFHKIKSFIFLMTIFTSASQEIFAQSELDKKLQNYIQMFKFEPVNKLQGKNKNLYYLGKSLFAEKALSGKRNISCLSCHDPAKGTGDSLPLSLGTNGAIIARNSPPLYNKGHKEFRMFFADMRVYHVASNDTYMTPEKGLNGVNPEYSDITAALSGPLAAQALFPMVDKHEMLGIKKPSKNRRYYWRVIKNRILSIAKYRNAMKKVFLDRKLILVISQLRLLIFKVLLFSLTGLHGIIIYEAI